MSTALPSDEARRVRPVSVYVALAVVALALADCARVALGVARAPRESDWRSAEHAVRAGFASGDLVVVAPAWADPTMRLYLGDLLPIPIAARADSDRFGRVWELSLRGARAPEAAPPADCQTVAEGRVRVRLCRKPAVRVLYDLTDRWIDARVALLRDGRELPCPFQEGGFMCAGASVTQAVGEIEYQPHRCILAPPPGAGEVLRIEWRDVPLGRGLVGYTGIHSFYSRKQADGPTEVAVFVDDQPGLDIVHRNRDGWRRFELAAAGPRERHARLRFDISSPRPEARTLCFAAESRD